MMGDTTLRVEVNPPTHFPSLRGRSVREKE